MLSVWTKLNRERLQTFPAVTCMWSSYSEGVCDLRMCKWQKSDLGRHEFAGVDIVNCGHKTSVFMYVDIMYIYKVPLLMN